MTTTPTAFPELPDLDRQFRKKPVVIEAVQWPGCRFPEPPPKWFADAMYKTPGKPGFLMRIGDDLFIDTLEGQMRAEPGDWIIQGIKGEIYPCKPEIFEASYERASRTQPEGEAPQADPFGWVFATFNSIQPSFEKGIENPWKDSSGAVPVYLIPAPAAQSDRTRHALEAALILCDTDEQRAFFKGEIEALNATPAATLSPLCGAQHAESGKEAGWECRRYCKGDGEWTEWRAIGAEEYERRKDDSAFEFRALAAQQAAAPGALEGRLVSVDVSTGDNDYANRIFAELTGETGSDGTTLIAVEKSRNFSAPGTPEAPEDERKGIELWRATLRACGELPEGYEVRIELENGCGMAVWYDAEGERHVIDGDGYLSADVNEAVDAAIQRAAQLDGGQEGSEVSNG